MKPRPFFCSQDQAGFCARGARARLVRACALVCLSALVGLSLPLAAADDDEAADANRDPVEWGREIAYGVGNCVSCHAMSTDSDDIISGNLGPVLVAMRVRYPDIGQLRAQIYNAAAKNPNSTMPPYGAHMILSEEEIDAVAAFVWEL